MHTIRTLKSYLRREYSIRGLANWVLDLAAELRLPVTNMALNKLVFFAYERLLIQDGVLLTNAKIEAWEHGPVFREIYQSFKSFDDKPIKARAKFFSPVTGKAEISRVTLLPEDEKILRQTLESLLPLSAARLRAISHIEGGAWHRVWWHRGGANPGMEITPELLIEASNAEQPN